MARNMYPHTLGAHSAYKKKRQTCRDRLRNAHTWMHKQTLTQTDVYSAHTQILMLHTHTHHSAVLSGQTGRSGGVRLSEQ